jgi:hypothetical protein
MGDWGHEFFGLLRKSYFLTSQFDAHGNFVDFRVEGRFPAPALW